MDVMAKKKTARKAGKDVVRVRVVYDQDTKTKVHRSGRQGPAWPSRGGAVCHQRLPVLGDGDLDCGAGITLDLARQDDRANDADNTALAEAGSQGDPELRPVARRDTFLNLSNLRLRLAPFGFGLYCKELGQKRCPSGVQTVSLFAISVSSEGIQGNSSDSRRVEGLHCNPLILYPLGLQSSLRYSCAGVAELADARDLKSRGPKVRVGSIPTPGTLKHQHFCEVSLNWATVTGVTG